MYSLTLILGKTHKLQIIPQIALLLSHCLLLKATIEMENFLEKVNQVTFHARGEL